MRLRSLLLAALLTLLALFAALNWTAINADSTLSLGFMDVHAPLGLVMLGFTILVCGALCVLILLQQAGIIMESRRIAKELKAQREIADRAEASRIAELKAQMESEFRGIEAEAATAQAALLQQLNDTGASIAAHLGELEDKLDRALGQSGGSQSPR